MRNGLSSAGRSVWNWSRASSTVGPLYHGIAAERAAMLSPSRPAAGMKQAGCTPILARNSEYSRTIPSKWAWL